MESEPHFRSIKAELRHQLMPAVSLRVLKRWAASRPKGSVQIATLRHSSSDGRGSIEMPEDEITVQNSRLWLDSSSRWRYEVDVPGGRVAVFVTDGPLWWSFAPSLHAHSNESAPDRYPGQREHQEWPLFHPEEVLANLIVTSTRLEDREGRPIEAIEAVARGDYAPFSLPSGADSYHLLVDRDRGVVLRMAARADGIEFSSIEITSLELDVPMEPELFRIELPEGVSFTPPPSHMPRPTLLRRVLGRLHLGPRY
jgi:hypothetical protein